MKNTTQDNREMNNLLSKVKRNNQSEIDQENIEFRDKDRQLADDLENSQPDFNIFNHSESIKHIRPAAARQTANFNHRDKSNENYHANLNILDQHFATE